MYSRLVVALLSSVVAAGPAPAAALVLRESGSRALAPLFAIWARDYAKVHPEVAVTVAGTGSRQGPAAAFAGTVEIGASDTFLSDEEARAHPGFIDIALATSAVAVVYALPELKAPLKLDGPTLASIYRGAVRSWDDPTIAELNPDIALPHRDIVPIRLADDTGEDFGDDSGDDSGETVAFAQYLATDASRDAYATLETPNVGWSETRGRRTLPRGPAREVRDGTAMIETLARTPYAVGYLALPLVGTAREAALGIAALRNHADEFLLPDITSINRAAAALTLRTPVDERISLIDAPGTGCYPLIAYAYAVVATKRHSEAEALALRDFLVWAIGRDVASFERIEAAGLVALRSSTWLASLSQIDLIH